MVLTSIIATLQRGVMALLLVFFATFAVAQTANVGAGKIWLAPRADAPVLPKLGTYRTEAMAKRALTTNTWYSSLVYHQWSDVLHAHPLTFKATEKGLEMGLPVVVSAPIGKVKPWAGAGGPDLAVVSPHQADITVAPLAFYPKDARLAAAGDWNIQVEMADGPDSLRARILHGSPYGYFQVSRGGVRLVLSDKVRVSGESGQAGQGKSITYLHDGERTFAIYAPKGARIDLRDPRNLELTLPPEADYFSIAALPDRSEETRDLFAKHAFAFVEDTRVEWNYDEASSLVKTRYLVKTHAMDGTESVPIIGLYLHHQAALSESAGVSPLALNSIRGPIKLMAANSFETRLPFNGLLPMWPGLADSDNSSKVKSLLLGDKRRASVSFGKHGSGTYWIGKALGSAAQLMSIAEQAGDEEAAKKLESLLKRRLESWFSGDAPNYFAHEKNVGTILGYPEEYFSVSAMNDHHFHYGYWIMAAAQLARRDPQWAGRSKWGGMVNLLIRDIATAQRGRVDFPFLRNFDVYEGHSWARGDSQFHGHGNDQESSSEAIHAWAAIALWGEQIGDRSLRDLGVYMYSTEVSSILNYWFDIQGKVFDKRYDKPLASMVFGGAYAYSTWFTEEPRMIQGINLLPISTASTYLAKLSPAYAKKFVSFAEEAHREFDASGKAEPGSADIWQDIIASFLAIFDPDEALKIWKPKGNVELGDTRTRTLHWINSLQEMGVPDMTVTADTMMYSVFRKPGSGARTYVAFNAGTANRTVKFSDGFVMTVQPGKLARATKAN